jgi:hypothetical protein
MALSSRTSWLLRVETSRPLFPAGLAFFLPFALHLTGFAGSDGLHVHFCMTFASRSTLNSSTTSLRIAWENRLHDRRDVTLREDASQVRKGTAPRTLAILNSFLLALFDWLGVTNVASQMRTFNAHPILALRLFFFSLQRIK